MSSNKHTKILLYNVGYCAGLDGSVRGYVKHFLRYLYTPKKVVQRVLASVDHLVDREKPDICCFVEVRRVRKFINRLWEYPFHSFENKYGRRSIFRYLPYFRKNVLGFFSLKSHPFRRHFLRTGMKKLVYEIDLGKDVSLFFSHFALRKRTRRKQLKELEHLIKQRKQVILCGDFNIFDGVHELEEFIEECGLKIVNTLEDVTFPAVHPQKALDLFLCSASMHIEDLKVLHPQASDHLPVLLKVRI